MPMFRATFGFVKYTSGASETYISADISLSGWGPKLQQLIDARNAILPEAIQWTGVRYSTLVVENGTVSATRRSRFLPPGTYSDDNDGIAVTIPSKGGFLETGPAQTSDQSKAVLQCRVVFDSDRTTTRYLFGVPDSILRSEPLSYDPNGNPKWVTAFQPFKTRITDGSWFIVGLSRTGAFAPKKILNWVQSAAEPEDVGIVLPALPVPPIVEGSFIRIRNVRRKGTDKLSYNGRYFVSAVNTTLLPDKVIIYLRGTEMGEPDTVKLPGTVNLIGHQLYAIQKFSGLRAGTHKRGRPFGQSPGRRSTRVSLDP